MLIRKAVAGDEPRFKELIKVFQSEVPMADWELVGKAFQQIIKDAGMGSIFVAEDNGTLLGTITLSYPVAARCGGLYSCIEEFAVSEMARGKGVGGSLLQIALEEARSKGCFEVQVNNPSRMCYPVYLRYGFIDTGKHLKQTL